MSSSEERQERLLTDLAVSDRRLYKELVELGENGVMESSGLKHWQREYLKAERDLTASLGSKETVAYLQAKSELLREHAENIR